MLVGGLIVLISHSGVQLWQVPVIPQDVLEAVSSKIGAGGGICRFVRLDSVSSFFCWISIVPSKIKGVGKDGCMRSGYGGFKDKMICCTTVDILRHLESRKGMLKSCSASLAESLMVDFVALISIVHLAFLVNAILMRHPRAEGRQRRNTQRSNGGHTRSSFRCMILNWL